MDPSLIALVVCALFLLVTLITGILPGLRVSHSVAGFVAADRTMGPVLLYFVLGASIFSSFAFLGGPGWAYSRGAAALLHRRLRGDRHGADLLRRTAGAAAGRALRLRHPGRAARPPLRQPGAVGAAGGAVGGGLHPLPDPADEGGGLHPGGALRRPGVGGGGGGGGLRGGAGLRADQRRPRGGLDQRPPGRLHDGDRLVPRALSAFQALRRGGGDVRADRGQRQGGAAHRPRAGRRRASRGGGRPSARRCWCRRSAFRSGPTSSCAASPPRTTALSS